MNTDTLVLKIISIIESDIKPYIVGHNGDIVFHEYKNGTVYVALTGACVTCPFSSMTLKLGVLEMLQKEIPEICNVELI
jgi:Fe-S cluster biogenesis protein NfuA